MRSLKHNVLPLTVFITGAIVLIVEVVAIRVLSPHYGNTIYTVSSVISVILAALSFGYFAGGRLADRHPSEQWFFGIILVSGLSLLLFHTVGAIFLPSLSNSLSLSAGPLVSALLLFFLPAFLLGTLSPYAIKLQNVLFPERGVGSVAGTIFFWSTLGSISGSLLAGFVFIPHFGINQIIVACGVVLFFLGLLPLAMLGLQKLHLFSSLFALVVVLGLVLFAVQQVRGDVLYSKDGVYEKITIFDGEFGGRPARFFKQDRSSSGAMFLDSQDPLDLAYDYTKYFALYKVFKPNVENALVIGGGAYSIPKALLEELPEASVDVAEIEPSLFVLAKEYFGLNDDPRLHNFVEDGRRLLHDSDKKYDLIFSDVYYSLYSVPAHFTTREFFEVAKDKLSREGIFVANMIGSLSRQQPSLIMSEIKTFKSVFPNSYFFAVRSSRNSDSQNIIFVGYNGDKAVDFANPLLANNADPFLRSLEGKLIDMDRFELSPYATLSDNFSPVEYLTALVLNKSFGQHDSLDGGEMMAVIDQQLRYGPRYLSAPGHQDVQKFLLAEMSVLTHEAKAQTFSHTSSDGENYRLTNIIGRLFPEQERRIVLATHYDSKKFADKDPSQKDQPVPGANDSASGVAVLVELARVLGRTPAAATGTPKVGIDFVYFDGEEGEENLAGDYSRWQPLGSTYFAEHLSDLYPGSKPISGLVLDMVCDKDLKISKEQSSAQNAPDYVNAFWNIGQKIDGEVFQNEVGKNIRDDHTALNRAGIPSFLVIDFDYPPFHTTEDRLEKCSAESLSTVAEAVINYAYALK